MSQRLDNLLAHVSKADPEDEGRQVAIQNDLEEMRQEVARGGSPILGRYLEAAHLLVSYQLKLGSVGGDVVRSLLVRVLRLAAVAEQTHAQDDLPPLSEEYTDPGGERARLISNLLLGEILQRRGEIRPEDEEAAIELQQQTGLRFGEALVKLGATTWAAVEDALGYQDRCRHVVENFVELPGVDERRSRAKLPTSHEIETVRERIAALGLSSSGESRKDHKRGEPALSARLQDSVRGPDPDLSLISDLVLGEIIVRQRLATHEQLAQALTVQRATGVRIGEALVQNGVLSWDDVNYAIGLQGEMRRYA